MTDNFVSLECPSCGAPVEVNVKEKTGFCKYCRRKFACKEALNSPQYKDYQEYQNKKQLEGDEW
ncbi:MAG: hypothetical protein FWC79_06235 [Oscillospiraceae bacterium]|nr:hypothetical protein [Oscillospiraceae bacterium]